MRSSRRLVLAWVAFLLICGFTPLLCAVPAGAATFVVTNRADDNTGGDITTLRGAIAAANALPDADTITFSLPVGNTITVLSPLTITQPVTIDGGQTQVVGAAHIGINVLMLPGAAAGSVVRGLAIINGNIGVLLGSPNCQVQGCAIGLDWAGTAHPNIIGVQVVGADCAIGNPGFANRNIIAGNHAYGVVATGAARLKVQNNYFGTGMTGDNLLPNGTGVGLIAGTTDSLVGGLFAAEGNVISGNLLHGVFLSGETTSGNTVCGNRIGLSANEPYALLGNTNGVTLEGASGNLIGKPEIGGYNVIGGNTETGIALTRGAAPARLNRIQNNYIGLSPGNAGLANRNGILLLDADSNLIGGRREEAVNQRNFISGNALYGVYCVGDGNTISGNYIGVGVDGASPRGNFFGVDLQGRANLVGGMTLPSLFGNVISGQTAYGVGITSGTDNQISGNSIGLDALGTTPLPNQRGILLAFPAARGTLIGGPGPFFRNIISGNAEAGLLLEDSGPVTVCANYFGTDISGTGVLANGTDAITIRRASGCLIGGTLPGQRNLLAGAMAGVHLESQDAFGNTIAGNWINVGADGSVLTPALQVGVALGNSANGNQIGLRADQLGNLIAGVGTGLYAADLATLGNGFYGNTVCGFTVAGITLSAGAHLYKAPPVITSASPSLVAGTSQPFNYIEVFKSDRGAGYSGGSLTLAGTGTADAAGVWSIPTSGLLAGDFACATAFDPAMGSSPFSVNFPVTGAANTPTQTPTVLASFTPTRSATPTPTATPTRTPTASPTASPTPTSTWTATATFTATRTPSPTRSPTATPSPSPTASPSATPSRTASATASATRTASPTATHSATRTPSPTISVTRTPSPTVTNTRAPADVDLGGAFTLAFPNPANERVNFLVHPEQAGEIRILVYNPAGELVHRIRQGLPPGRGQILTWPTAEVGPGIYFVRVYWDGQEKQRLKVVVWR